METDKHKMQVEKLGFYPVLTLPHLAKDFFKAKVASFSYPD